jgi:hypothetical protein
MKFMIIDPTGTTQLGLGEFTFLTAPKIGEWIEINESDISIVYVVVAVLHSTACSEVSIYVKRLGELEEVLSKLPDQPTDGLLQWMKLGENP